MVYRADSSLTYRGPSHAQASFILEELDRAFRPDKKVNAPCHLLKTLDGVGNAEGVIVAASANHPEDLDAAIPKRPGRFDRVVY